MTLPLFLLIHIHSFVHLLTGPVYSQKHSDKCYQSKGKNESYDKGKNRKPYFFPSWEGKDVGKSNKGHSKAGRRD